jgi:hypothetical protein
MRFNLEVSFLLETGRISPSPKDDGLFIFFMRRALRGCGYMKNIVKGMAAATIFR